MVEFEFCKVEKGKTKGDQFPYLKGDKPLAKGPKGALAYISVSGEVRLALHLALVHALGENNRGVGAEHTHENQEEDPEPASLGHRLWEVEHPGTHDNCDDIERGLSKSKLG